MHTLLLLAALAPCQILGADLETPEGRKAYAKEMRIRRAMDEAKARRARIAYRKAHYVHLPSAVILQHQMYAAALQRRMMYYTLQRQGMLYDNRYGGRSGY